MSEGPRWRREWPEFEELMRKRLQAGYENYGDWSFDRPLVDKDGLFAMVEEELLDIMGWGFIAWTRLQRMRRMLEQ